MACILIAGANGLVGQRLTQVLQAAGHEVRWLVRNPNGRETVRTFAWNPERHELPEEALHETDVIISLAGAPIAGSRWTTAYKHTILQSRLDAAQTLMHSLNNTPHRVSCVISASAIGYYGNRDHEILDENSKMGTGFLSETTAAWESAYASCPVRHITIRIGIVLSRDGGALPKLEAPLRAGVASILGPGNQVMSWIHIDDLCAIFLHALSSNSANGTYNGVAPHPVEQRAFMRTLRRIVNPVSLLLPAPALALRLLLGEQAALVLDSTFVSCDRVLSEGFQFKFPHLSDALKDLYGKN